MARSNPEVNYVAERLTLRSIYVNSTPKARLGVIRQRLAHAEVEIGPTKLVTVVSAVEAFARSIVVHSKATASSDIKSIYTTFRDRGPEVLVEDALKFYGQKTAAEHLTEDTWPLFLEAVNFRNQIVHECTYLGQDKYPSLIRAAEEVLEALVNVSGLGEVRTYSAFRIRCNKADTRALQGPQKRE